MSVRVLFVDDDPAIQETMPPILRMHGFEVVASTTVPEALAEISLHPFDVLIADLNVGEPGDGFTIVSAMRRTQRDCVTFILTGYPGLETALQAIRSQVDDYLIKPTKIPELVAAIESKLKNLTRRRLTPTKRVSDILGDNTAKITERVLQQMQSHPVIGPCPSPTQNESVLLPC